MFFFTLLHHYIWWHYSASLAGYVRVSRNFWWYLFHIFSLSQLTATLFAPYKRMTEHPDGHFSFEGFFERTILNFFSRLVGAIIRLFILIIGTATILIYTFMSLAGFALWLGTPIFICLGIVTGIWFLLL